MKNIKYVILAALLVGCAKVEEKSVIVTETKYIGIPDILIKDCLIPSPPDREKYLNLSLVEKEITLSELYLDAVSLNTQCNIRLSHAREYQEKMKKLYNVEVPDADPSIPANNP